MMDDNCIICGEELKDEWHQIHGFKICKSCTDIYEKVYTMINGKTDSCYVKRKLL